MRRYFFVILFFAILFNSQAQESILGFTPENAKKQMALEDAFEAKLSTDNLDKWMQLMAAEPHWVGTAYGEKNAKWIQKQFKSWSYDAKIETYHILFPYPKTRILEMTGPTNYKAKLTAVPVDGDEFTAQGDSLLPSYNAFSTDGNVEAELVFVNYGIPKDYDELERSARTNRSAIGNFKKIQ